MSQYYFTVASLPFLRYEEQPALSLLEFYEICGRWLKPADHDLVLNAKIDDLSSKKRSCSLLMDWIIWETNLRNGLVSLRASKIGVEASRYLVDSPYLAGLSDYAQEAFEKTDPLKAEDFLNRIRWLYLEELEVGHYFDTEKLIVYSLKLQLLERKFRFDRERGHERFNMLSGGIIDQLKVGEI